MDRRTFFAGCAALAAAAIDPLQSSADETSAEEFDVGMWNPATATLGGRQFWADELFFHDWHIQRNVFTDHCRLLDGANHRHLSGTFDECRKQLDAIKAERGLPAMKGPAVVMLHGLFRSASAMRHLASYLKEQGGYSVFNINYPTTRGSIADHAQSLAKIVDGLEGIERIHFVAHSLGNLVVRHYLGDCTDVEKGASPTRESREW